MLTSIIVLFYHALGIFTLLNAIIVTKKFLKIKGLENSLEPALNGASARIVRHSRVNLRAAVYTNIGSPTYGCTLLL